MFPGAALDEADSEPRVQSRVACILDRQASARLGVELGELAY